MRTTAAVLLLALSLAAAGGLAGRAADAAPSSRDAALRQALLTRRLSKVRFEAAKPAAVLSWLRAATGWNFVLRAHVLRKAGIDPDAIEVTLSVDDVTVAQVLDLAFSGGDLAVLVEGNIVFVTTKADALGPPVFVMYPISHLTWPKTDFHGPDIDLYPSDFTPPEREEETIDESDPFLDPQHVVDLVREMVDAPWDSDGWTLRATKAWLFVRAPRSVQARVARAVEEMAALK
jgi:hypothetical protein